MVIVSAFVRAVPWVGNFMVCFGLVRIVFGI